MYALLLAQWGQTGRRSLTSMGFCDEKPVFVDTTLGTHLAFPVHPDITAGDLKSKLVWEHSSCFPNLGEIKIHAVMVKRKTHLYHLPDPMPIKNACEGLVGAWFLCVDASWLQDMPRQETCIRSTSQKLSSSKCLRHRQDKNREVIALQGNSSRENKDSMSNSSEFTDCSESESNLTVVEKNMRCQAGKCCKDHLIHSEEKVEVLYAPIFSKKESRRIVGQRNADCVVCGTLKEPGKFASTEEMHILKTTSCLNHEEDDQVKNNTIIDESLFVDKSCKKLSEHPLKCKRDKSSFSIYETPTMSLEEKTSVTGIISTYFPDFDEVDSCSTQSKNTRDIKKLIKQSEMMPTLEEMEQNEMTGCTTKIAESSVDQTSLKKTIVPDFVRACSFNIIASDVNQFGHNIAGKCKRLDKSENFAFAKESKAMGITRKTKKASSFVVSDEYRTGQSADELAINNVNRSKRRAKKESPSTPCSASKMSSLPQPFDMDIEASSSKTDRYKVGRRLIHAANNIELSDSGKCLRKSMFVPRFGNLSMAKSTGLIGKIAFEISNSDD